VAQNTVRPRIWPTAPGAGRPPLPQATTSSEMDQFGLVKLARTIISSGTRQSGESSAVLRWETKAAGPHPGTAAQARRLRRRQHRRGSTLATGLPLAFDQRGAGFNRSVGAAVDIGAHDLGTRGRVGGEAPDCSERDLWTKWTRGRVVAPANEKRGRCRCRQWQSLASLLNDRLPR